ncbi:hypothetical protein GCM10023350_37270 [Nocardioides endophyticus]|uniref:Antitoxin Xre/MbcA/ParS-like toxin-binding domain-containing protein n=1 Tax=Nocardioides endophyticus TaxID=1353775 RepID=A0ABP8Z7F2_9ACTN
MKSTAKKTRQRPRLVEADSDADVFAQVARDDLASSVQRAVELHAGIAAGARVRVYVASVLNEGRLVDDLAGPAFDVIEHMDADRQHQLVIRSTAHRAVLDEPLLESTAVGEALGRSGTNGREAASKLRLAGRLVGIKQANRYLFPAFQIDLAHQRVAPVVAEVNQLLDAADDPWGVASWWISASPRLGGKAPRDLIGTADESDLVVLARAESNE